MREHAGLRVAGAVLPRLELSDVRVLDRSRLVAEGLGRATVVIWPEGDRGRPQDICWVGVARLNRHGLTSSVVPPLPAVEFRGRELERLERAGQLATVLREEGLARTMRYDVRVHGPEGRLERMMWSVRPVAAPLGRACGGRRHAPDLRALS